MAIVQLHPMFTAIRGRVGDVVYKTYRDKVVVTRVPRMDHLVATAGQRTQRDRLKAATAHARQLYADPIAKAALVARAKLLDRQPFRLAISEFLAAPPASQRTANRANTGLFLRGLFPGSEWIVRG